MKQSMIYKLANLIPIQAKAKEGIEVETSWDYGKGIHTIFASGNHRVMQVFICYKKKFINFHQCLWLQD